MDRHGLRPRDDGVGGWSRDDEVGSGLAMTRWRDDDRVRREFRKDQ